MADHEAEYSLRRASEETVRALNAGNPAAEKVHRDLSVHYSARAVTLLAEEQGQPLQLKLRPGL